MGSYALAKRIEELGKPELLGSAAHYYSVAAFAGRGYAVPPLVKLLDAHGASFKPATIKGAKAALEKQAVSGNEFALNTLARYYSEGTVFPRDDERARELLGEAAEKGNAKAALDVAYELLSGTPDDAKRADALRYLAIAARTDNFGQRAIAENLIRDLQSPATPTATVSEISP
jgi:TPR repeat protein